VCEEWACSSFPKAVATSGLRLCHLHSSTSSRDGGHWFHRHRAGSARSRMYLLQGSVARVLTIDNLTGILLTFLLAAIGGVMGVHRITRCDETRCGPSSWAIPPHQATRRRRDGRHLSGGTRDVERPCVIKLIRPDKVGDEKTLARSNARSKRRSTLTLEHRRDFRLCRTEDGTFYYVMEYLPA